MSAVVTTRRGDETEAVGAAFGALLRRGDVVLVAGDLGAGKTTFVKGVARALGVRDRVTSPTFTIVQEYEGRIPVAHVDVYRLERVQELHDVGFAELLDGRVVLVEWGDKVEPVMPGDRIEVRLAPGDEPNVRTITFVPHGASWHARAQQLAAALRGHVDAEGPG
jgi:tRNA threonylcarbamoyladenosine biosynthesis protein TsaE